MCLPQPALGRHIQSIVSFGALLTSHAHSNSLRGCAKWQNSGYTVREVFMMLVTHGPFVAGQSCRAACAHR